MAWDFTIDSEIQSDLSTKLKDASTEYQGKVDEMYGIIGGDLASAWIGEDYDAYKVSTDGYKTALADLGKTINMFGLHYESMKTGTATPTMV